MILASLFEYLICLFQLFGERLLRVNFFIAFNQLDFLLFQRWKSFLRFIIWGALVKSLNVGLCCPLPVSFLAFNAAIFIVNVLACLVTKSSKSTFHSGCDTAWVVRFCTDMANWLLNRSVRSKPSFDWHVLGLVYRTVIARRLGLDLVAHVHFHGGLSTATSIWRPLLTLV